MTTQITIIKDLRKNTEFAAQQWEIYQKAVRRIGDTDSLREANEGLGYNLVKTIPGLLQWIQELQEDNDALRMDITTRQPRASTPEAPDKDRPLGIPAEHIIINIGDSPELEVVTEEAPRHWELSGSKVAKAIEVEDEENPVDKASPWI